MTEHPRDIITTFRLRHEELVNAIENDYLDQYLEEQAYMAKENVAEFISSEVEAGNLP